MKYSIIIITKNEEEMIRECIRSVRNAAVNYSDYEIIVSDGGSTDNTIRIAEEEKVIINKSPIGRGVQNNTGARLAKGEFLIFLHADTLFAKDGFSVITKGFDSENIKIGKFKMKFDELNFMYKFYSYFTKYDSVLTSFGDQCIVVRKSFYNELGGFPDWQIFEDVHFLKKARRSTKLKVLPSTVFTSARRYKKNGLLIQQLRNLYYIFLYYTGINHKNIKEKYGRTRSGNLQESLILFVKYPEEGKVKSRLGKTIGFERATKIYTQLAEHSFNEAKKLSKISRYLFFANEKNRNKITNWVGLGFSYYPQSDGDLGTKMKSAFYKVIAKGSNKTLIIGSDLPDISKSLISKGFRDLDRNDIVIGPSKDGGYYLLGMKKFYPELFSGIDWSTEQVLEQTLEKANSLNLSVSLLKELNDIDTIDDLNEWQIKEHKSEDSNSLSNKLALELEGIQI